VRVPHPIPYQGSKRRLAPLILRYFPPDTETLIEPFAGSAAVSLAAACYGAARRFVINDTNSALIELWRAIVQRPEEVADAYERLWLEQQGQERKFYDRVRNEFNRRPRPAHFLYLLARCVKASVRYNANGEFNQSPDNRRRGAKPSTMREQILAASRLLRGKVLFSDKDYKEVLAAAGPAEVVYMDPPYQGVSSDRDPRYVKGVGFEGFSRALRAANDKGLAYIVSYDGRTGYKQFGSLLPEALSLHRIEVDVGRSSQATLLGRTAKTFESLYLSPALTRRLDLPRDRRQGKQPERVSLSEATWLENGTHPSLFDV